MADLLTPSAVRDLLARHGLAPRKQAGQNFVVDPNTVRRIVASADLGPDDTVIEIGPGLGSLTVALADTVARVVAIEIDAGLVRALQETLAEHDNVEVVHTDALGVPLGSLVDGGPARVVANLPYNVATPLIMHALDDPAVTDLFVFVLLALGSYRLQRLLTTDEIGRPVRELCARIWGPLGTWASCPWCAPVYSNAAIVFAVDRWFYPMAMPVLWWGAVCTIVGFLGELEPR